MISQDQLIGSRFEKCTVERLIGRGGYGLTFLAFDDELQEHRVIKVSLDSNLDEASRTRHLKSFLEEGLILSRLKHPQIVTLRGQGDKHGHRYMILDYIQGFSLRNVVDIVGQRQVDLDCAWQDLLDPVTASALILSALYPLEYAHRANVHLPDREIFGVAHRDISPGNLILGVKGNEKGRLVLIDFGTAKTELTENVTMDQNLVGTIPYMGKARLQKANSPQEKAQYHSFWKDFRETQHDIHAIGVLYFQLLTGRLPFPGETSPQVIVKILDPEVYSQLHLEIAASFSFASGVLRKCLVYHDFSTPLGEQPYQYPDAGAMRPDLEEAFHSLSGGRSVSDVLIAFGKKLAHPELMSPHANRMPSEEFSTMVMPALPKPGRNGHRRFPARTNRTGIVLAGTAVLCILVLGAALWLSPRQRIDNAKPLNAHAGAKIVLDANPGFVPSTPAILQPGSSVDLGNQNGVPPDLENLAPPQKQKGSPKKPVALMPVSHSSSWNKSAFLKVLSLISSDDPKASEWVAMYLAANPGSPELRLLNAQLTLKRKLYSQDVRSELADLQRVQPKFMRPDIFHEQVKYLLWATDLEIFASQKTPINRVRLMKSTNAYLAEFQSNPAYQIKVKTIQERLPP